jgi:hypothetical protein
MYVIVAFNFEQLQVGQVFFKKTDMLNLFLPALNILLIQREI